MSLRSNSEMLLARSQVAAAATTAKSLHGRSHCAMGTEFTLYIDVPDQVEAQACFQAVFAEIDRIEQTFSRFRADSEISRINSQAADGPTVTDPEVFQLLATAQNVSRKTGGVFDFTLGRLTRAWGFPGRRPRIPDSHTLAALEACIGWTNVELDPAWRTVLFLRPGLELDLGGIAKGYAVDCALDMLRSIGVQGLIDAGSSSIAARDETFSRSWKVNITRGMDSTIVLPEAQLGNRALSTSGVMEQSFVQEGRIYSHLIDPTAHGVQTDRPVRQMLQATVLATNSTLADALSTAMFLLGHERGPAVLSQFVDCSALWVYDDGKNIVYQTHAWPGGNDSFN